MRKLRLGKVIAAIAGAATLALGALPASAAVHEYEFTTTGAIDVFDLFGQPVDRLSLDGGGGTECAAIPDTLSVDDSAQTFTATIASDKVTQILGLWFRAELATTISGDYTGTGPYSLDGTGSAVAGLRRVSGPTDCTPDNPGQVCTFAAINIAFDGTLDDNGHGVGGLAPTDEAELDGSNSIFETSVVDSGTECGGVTAYDNGHVEVVGATIGEFT